MRREVLLVALSGDAMTERQFRELAEDIKESCAPSGCPQVQVLGGRDYEIGIEVSEERCGSTASPSPGGRRCPGQQP
jgi:hypothetical protein